VGTPTASLDLDLTSNIESEIVWEIPRLGKGQKLDLNAIRDPKEKFYLGFVFLPTVIITIILIVLPFLDDGIPIFFTVIGYSLLFILLFWISWQFFLATLQLLPLNKGTFCQSKNARARSNADAGSRASCDAARAGTTE
jgi:hypothetical protein